MARDILKSNNSIVIAGERPAFSTTDRTGDAMSGAFMSSVQDVSVGFSMERQKLKQIGSQSLSVNDINRMPDVALSISYYYTPAMFNENMLGLIDSNPSYDGTGFFEDYTNEDQNFYILNRDNQGSDFIEDDPSGDFFSSMLSGYEAGDDDIELLSVGNAFLTNYSLSFEIGKLPVVSTSYVGSNLSFENLTGSAEITNPAINLQSGNTNGAGLVDLEEAKTKGFDYYSDLDRFRPPLCSPTDVNVTLQNLQIGGAPISGDAHLQSFSFNVPIGRVPLFGLGSNYPYGRKVKYPITSPVSLEFLVSGFATGEIASLISNESSYDFDIQIVDTGEEYQNTFSFEDLKLESSSYQMAVNDRMSYSLNFSHEITN